MKKRFLSLCLIILSLIFIPFTGVKATLIDETIKDIFIDENLRSEIKEILDKNDEDYIEIEDINEVTELKLDGKNIKDIKGIEVFTNLRVLDLDNNEIVKIPSKIGELKSLEVLSINNNELEEIPNEIGELESLEELSISDNRIEELPVEIGSLGNLKKLNINSNLIEEIPSSLGNIFELQILLANNNLISFLPDEMENLKKLMVLDLYSNKLNSLDSSLLGMDSLYYINLGSNRIYSFGLETYEKVKNVKGFFNLSNQNQSFRLSNKGIIGRDYSIFEIDILKFNLGYEGTYYLINPNGNKEEISVEDDGDNVIIPGSLLENKGKYTVVLNITDDSFNDFGSVRDGQNGSNYTASFLVEEVGLLPSQTVNQYILIGSSIFVLGLLVLVIVRVIKRNKKGR